MKILTGIIVWTCIIAYLIALSYFNYMCYTMSQNYAAREAQGYKPKGYTDASVTWKWIFYVLTGFNLFSIAIVACSFRSIRISIEIMKVAGHFVRT